MTGPKKPVGTLRRACDRCHGQKLSCQRDGNDGSRPCTRCLRAETPCSTSLSQRNRRTRTLPSAMSTPVAAPTTFKRLHNRQSDGGNDGGNDGGDAIKNSLVKEPERGSGPGPDGSHDATNDGLPDALGISAGPTPSAEAMDWILFDWENGGLNPFSMDNFDPSKRAMTPDTLGGFTDPLYGFQHLGAVTSLTSPPSAREAGHPLPAISREPGPIPWPSSVHSTSVPGSQTGLPSASGDAASGRPPQADGQWLQRLVEINMQLFDHANQAKSKDGNSDPVSDSTRDNEASTIRRPPGFNSFDETIVLSFYLVKALHSQYTPESLRMDEKSSLPVGPPPKLDSGTMLIIFSCYVRVLDLFMDRLGALRSALSADAAPPPATSSSRAATATPSFLPPNGSSPNSTAGPGSGPDGAALLLPTLVACGCPLEGYPVLRLRMTLELVEEVLEVTSALVTPIVHGMGDESQPTSRSLMPVVSPQALSAREQAAYRVIREIRMELRRHRSIMVI